MLNNLFFQAAMWPLWVVCVLLVVAAAENLRSGKVPNVITIPTFLSGLLVAILISAKVESFSRLGGGLAASGVSFLIISASLFKLWNEGVAPSGCVKMQMAVSVWIGCVFPINLAMCINLSAMVGAIAIATLAYAVAYDRHRRISLDESERSSELFPLQLYASLGAILGLLVAVTSLGEGLWNLPQN